MIDPKEIEIKSLNPFPQGGQHVSVFPVGVRIEHVSGITVECDSERSQLRNRDKALRILELALTDPDL